MLIHIIAIGLLIFTDYKDLIINYFNQIQTYQL